MHSHESPYQRRRILDAAHRVLERNGGLTISLQTLRVDDVLAEARTSRTAIYRIWGNVEGFYQDLLVDLAGSRWNGADTLDDDTVSTAHKVISENLTKLSTPEGRLEVTREVIRRAAEINYRSVSKSVQWRSYIALTAAADQRKLEGDEAIYRELRDAEANFRSVMTQFYEQITAILGLRLKYPELGFGGLANVGASVVQGIAIRAQLDPEAFECRVTPSFERDDKTWHVAALAYLAVFEELVEINPEYDQISAMAQALRGT